MAIMAAVIAADIAASGCIKGFQGANVELDLSPATPVQAHYNAAAMAPGTGEIPTNSHFILYAIQQGATQDALFELTRFEIHRIVDLTSPCFIDVGEHVPHPGLHVSMYDKKIEEDTMIPDPANPPASASEADKEKAATAVQRMANIAALSGDSGLRALTSASTTPYPAVASGCTGPQDQIPPPQCTDDASNQLRLQLCQATWKKDPNLWEGTDRVLTEPLAGTTHGMVLNPNDPVSHAPVGGAQFFVDNALTNVNAYAIYFQVDGMADPGTQLYFGKPTTPTRGVDHIHLVSPINPLLTAEMAVFEDLGSDDVQF